MPFFRFLRPLGLSAVLLAVSLPARAEDDLAGPYLAARAADMAGDYAAVVAFGTQALAQDPENTGLMEGLIIAEIGLGEISAAVPVGRRLAAIEPDSQIAGLVLLADAMQREDWSGAETILEGGISLGGLMDQMIRAWAAIGQGKMSRAVELFDALAADEGTAQAALFQKALALALVGDYESAAGIMGGTDTVLKLNQAGIVAYAEVLSQLERNEDAVALIDSAFPGSSDPELVTLRAELAAGKPVPFSAIKGPREGLSQLFYEVGQSILGETDPGLVLVYARIAGHLNPGHVGAQLLAAQVLEDMENYPLAAEAYGRIPEGARAYPQAQMGRAVALRRMGDTGAAIEVLRAATQVYPDLAPLHAALGDMLRFEQRYAEALPSYDAAIALYDTDLPAQWGSYFSRGICNEREGNWAAAEADFRKALALSPDQPSVLNYLGYSYVEKRINLDEALDMIQRAVAARPYDGYIRDSLGWVYYRLGRYGDAVEEMERAVELMPLDPVLNDHLGDTYWAVGRTREAEFQWRRALSFVTDETDIDELNPDRIRRKLEVGLDAVLEEEGGEPIAQ